MRLADGDNPALPQRCGEFATLTEGLDYAARGRTGYNFFSGRGEPLGALTYRDVKERAIDLAAKLVAMGMPRGSRLAILAETSPDFMIFFFACQYAGVIPVPLPLSAGVSNHQAHVSRLRAMIGSAQPIAAVAPASMVHVVREAGRGLGVEMIGSPNDFYALPRDRGDLRPFGPRSPCYIQYSSGSTTEPRGVLLSQRAVIANARAISQDGLRVTAGDRTTSWLPLYHDMGLIGFCITPMLCQLTVDYIATAAFAVRPLIWLKLISEYRSTISFSPTFGYELCVRRAGMNGGTGFALSNWRVAGVGGEMVRPEALQRFADVFAASGFEARSFVPSYGLAEASLAVSFAPLETGVAVDTVDREQYERCGRAIKVIANTRVRRVRSFTRCGPALPGYTIEVRDDGNAVLPDRTIGRVLVRGPSLMSGYYRNSERTRQTLSADGWLDTGDMGYLIDGSLVITGRRKDLIICNGRNIWPQDLEWAVEQLADVRSGSVAAFSVDDEHDENERVVLVVECYSNDAMMQHDLRNNIHSVIQRTAAVNCTVVLVPPRSLPYTSSGKLSRASVRAQYLSGAIKPQMQAVRDDLSAAPQRKRVAAG